MNFSFGKICFATLTGIAATLSSCLTAELAIAGCSVFDPMECVQRQTRPVHINKRTYTIRVVNRSQVRKCYARAFYTPNSSSSSSGSSHLTVMPDLTYKTQGWQCLNPGESATLASATGHNDITAWVGFIRQQSFANAKYARKLCVYPEGFTIYNTFLSDGRHLRSVSMTQPYRRSGNSCSSLDGVPISFYQFKGAQDINIR